jgi:transcriptional enhancer factor
MSSSSGSSCSSPSLLSTSPTPSIHYSLQNTSTEDVFQSIVKSRKSWKTLKGGEIVWPPELEAALIEGAWIIRPLIDRLNLNLYAL